MKELTEEAKIFLTCIHVMDTRKVKNQVEVLAENRENIEIFQELSAYEYTNLISLLEKYLQMLNKIQ